MPRSIVEYFGEQLRSKCGYCKGSNGSNCHGIWAHQLTVQDYQDLIDRGWRRSGRYCYKPTMHSTCCPLYTIKCSALEVKLTKSQKKIIKKFNKFLNADSKEEHFKAPEDQRNAEEYDGSNETNMIPAFQPSLDVKFERMDSANSEEIHDSCSDQKVVVNNNAESLEGGVSTQSVVNEKSPILNDISMLSPVKKGVGALSDKPLCKKAKVIRMEKKRAKLAAKGVELSLEELRPNVNVKKSLEDLLNDAPQNALNRLKLRLIRSEEVSLAPDSEPLRVYQRYQTTIHGDPIEKVSDKQFQRFLVRSPLQPWKDYGSFHQQYYLDGRLIAVGVIDVLPTCISSVYFYYDPDFSHLSLGTYGSLREIALVRNMHLRYPNLVNYYMGFYVHTCPKMRYKARLSPSFLLCPETYSWHAISRCLSKIEASPYARLSESLDEKDENDVDETRLNDVLILFSERGLSYNFYQAIVKNVERDVILEYAKLIGYPCSQRMLLYRSS